MIYEILWTSCVPKLVICLLHAPSQPRARLRPAAARGGGRIGGHLAAAELHHTAAANAAAGDLKVPSTKPIRPGRAARGKRREGGGRWMEMEQNSFSKALTPSRNRRRHKSGLVSRQKIDRSFWVGQPFFSEQVLLKLF